VSGQPLLAGHLSLCRKLVIANPSHKARVGPMLLQGILSKLLFPASKATLELTEKKLVLSEEEIDIQPICSSSASRVSAFDLIVELSLHCLPNAEIVFTILSQLHRSIITMYVFYTSFPLNLSHRC
jgi:hypothetical protein